jgi:Periplasmic component of the Tol biopolymer transport system
VSLRVSQLLTLLTAGMLFSACAQKSVTSNVISTDFLLAKGSKQLTFLGDNERPRFSPSGDQILFFSSHRMHHKGQQIYELDLKRNTERRVTFSDGDAFDPMYLNDSEIVYSSTTDAIKENPLDLKNFDKVRPPSDLYRSDLVGTEIQRLTNLPSYDGQSVFVRDFRRPYILFTSSREDSMGLQRYDMQTGVIIPVLPDKAKEKRLPTVTSDRMQFAYVEKDLETKTESIWIAPVRGKAAPVMLKEKEGEYSDLMFAPEPPLRLLYSIRRGTEKNHQIEVYDIEGKCTQVLFKGADSLTSPTMSAQNKLAFVREFQEKKQIYIVDMPADLGPCLETQTGDTLKK